MRKWPQKDHFELPHFASQKVGLTFDPVLSQKNNLVKVKNCDEIKLNS